MLVLNWFSEIPCENCKQLPIMILGSILFSVKMIFNKFLFYSSDICSMQDSRFRHLNLTTSKMYVKIEKLTIRIKDQMMIVE